MGFLNASMEFLENSGSSSRKSTPLCAKDTSPGWALLVPPVIATCDTVWWGLRKGRCEINDVPLESLPATE
jgi:hypothetical protein